MLKCDKCDIEIAGIPMNFKGRFIHEECYRQIIDSFNSSFSTRAKVERVLSINTGGVETV